MPENEPQYSIFGASGFIGSALVSHLRMKGRRVRAIGRHEAPPRSHEKLHHVIFAIGVTADFRNRPLDTIDAHVTQINELLREGDFLSLTYLSSTRVYEGNASTAETAALVAKPAEPGALYNISKIAGESICLTCGRPNIRVARLSNVIGRGADQHSFIDQILREGGARGEVALRSHPDSVKDYIALEDVLNLLETISLRGRDRIYNVASGQQTSHRQVTDAIAREAGWRIEFDLDAPRTIFAPIDIERAKREFGFAPMMFDAYFPSHIRAFLEAAKGQQ
jgi:nucleoside-diphosphate-sugar epimerase